MKTTISHVNVWVRDQDEALAFYVNTLGFEVRLDAPISPTTRWIEVAPPCAGTSIALNAAEDGPAVGTDTGVTAFRLPL